MPASLASLFAAVLFLVVSAFGIMFDMFEGMDCIMPLGAALLCAVLSVVELAKGN